MLTAKDWNAFEEHIKSGLEQKGYQVVVDVCHHVDNSISIQIGTKTSIEIVSLVHSEILKYRELLQNMHPQEWYIRISLDKNLMEILWSIEAI